MELRESKQEIIDAETEYNSLLKSRTPSDFKRHWSNFLGHLEKAWNKSERECKDIPKFQPWQGTYKKLRRDDTLLAYLKNARDADSHSLQESVNKTHDSIGIKPVNQGPLKISELIIENNEVITYKGDPIIVQRQFGFICKSFSCSGKIYILPNYHRGVSVNDNSNPITLATLGLKFYQNYLMEIEKRF